MAKRRISPREAAARREALGRRAIAKHLEVLVETRVAQMNRQLRAIKRTAGQPARFERARERLRLAIAELEKARHLEREVRGIVRETEHRLATLELWATTRTLAALARFHASRPLSPPRTSPAADFDQAKRAVAIVVADRRSMREELARLDGDPARANEATRWRRELALQEAHLEALVAGLRALRDATVRDADRLT
jgi:hypothetical protein